MSELSISERLALIGCTDGPSPIEGKRAIYDKHGIKIDDFDAKEACALVERIERRISANMAEVPHRIWVEFLEDDPEHIHALVYGDDRGFSQYVLATPELLGLIEAAQFLKTASPRDYPPSYVQGKLWSAATKFVNAT